MSQQINLFNPIFLKQKKIFTAVPMAEALGAIVVGVLLLTWFARNRVDELEVNANVGKAVLAAREERLLKVNALYAPRAPDARLQTELADAEAELKSLHDAASTLQGGGLGNTEGYAEYFRAFSRQNVSGLWLTGVSINGAGADIGVQGRAMQATLIPHYISRLTAEHIMHGKTFATLDIARPEGVAGLQQEVAPAAAAQPATAGAPPFVEFNLQSTRVQEAGK